MKKTIILNGAKPLHEETERLSQAAREAREAGEILYVACCVCCFEAFSKLQSTEPFPPRDVDWRDPQWRREWTAWVLRALKFEDVTRAVTDDDVKFIAKETTILEEEGRERRVVRYKVP